MYKKIVIHVQNCCLAYETYRYQAFSLPSRRCILKTLKDPTTQPLDENVKDNQAQIRIHTQTQTNKETIGLINKKNNNSNNFAGVSRFLFHFFALFTRL